MDRDPDWAGSEDEASGSGRDADAGSDSDDSQSKSKGKRGALQKKAVKGEKASSKPLPAQYNSYQLTKLLSTDDGDDGSGQFGGGEEEDDFGVDIGAPRIPASSIAF